MFFKHPLFWKEWKTAKWWSTLMVSMLLVMLLSVNNALSLIYERRLGVSRVLTNIPYITSGNVEAPIFLRQFYDSFTVLIILWLPVILLMSIILFQSERKENTGMFVSSLPFTKKEQFGIKWFVGVLAITIPFLLATLFTVLMYQANIDWITQWYTISGYDVLLAYDSIWIVLGIVTKMYLFILAFFSAMMLMQSLIANNIAAGIIGSISLAAPWFIIEAGSASLARILNSDKVRIYGREWSNFYLFALGSGSSRRFVSSLPGDMYIDPIVSNEHDGLKIIILIAIIVLAIYGGLKSYEKNDNSRNGYLLMFPWVGKILVPGVTLCSGILGNNLMRDILRISSVPFEILTLVISALIGYFIIVKVIERSEKYGG